MTRGRPIRGFFGGLLLGICIDLDLVLGGVVRLDNAVLTILPVILVVLFFALGLWAPIGRSHRSPAPPLASPLPRPVAWPESAPTEGSTAPTPGPTPLPPVPPQFPGEPPTSPI